jgi:hypothetical protein
MTDKKRVPQHVFNAMINYLKYRYSHLTESELFERREKTLKALREATPEEQERYYEKVNVFMENNADLIAQAKKGTEVAEFQERLKETMSRNRAQ